MNFFTQYAILQLRIVRSGLHLVTYLDVGNFCDKSTETNLHEICVQVFLRFSDSSKPSQSVLLFYELAWLAGIGKSEENLLKTSYKVAPVTKVAQIYWWRHDNGKQSTSAREHWCDVSCDIPYYVALICMYILIHVNWNQSKTNYILTVLYCDSSDCYDFSIELTCCNVVITDIQPTMPILEHCSAFLVNIRDWMYLSNMENAGSGHIEVYIVVTPKFVRTVKWYTNFSNAPRF